MSKFSSLLAAVALMSASCDGSETPTPPPPPPPERVRVTGVEISSRTLPLEIGGRATLSARVLPEDAENREVAWSSDDGAVATVSPEGEVRAVGTGSTSVTVITADGGFRAVCTVFVTPELDPDDILTRIPDPVFRARCRERLTTPGERADPAWDVDANGKLSPREAEEVRIIDVGRAWNDRGGERIVSLRGIEYFTGLAELHCGFNRLAELDVSKNTALTILNCAGTWDDRYETTNRIAELDLSNNAALVELNCSSNRLAGLDLSNNTKLEILNCDDNLISALDVSMLPALRGLWCGLNRLGSMDISKNSSLREFWCDFNPGDGATFPVTAWFDNDSYPYDVLLGTDTSAEGGSWRYGRATITVDYRKAN